MRRTLAFARLFVVALPIAACGGSDDVPPGDDEHYDCSMETRADTFVVGLEKVSPAGAHFILMSANPAPPGRGDNDFVLHLEDSSLAPMTGASLTIRPYMPDHGHGTAVPVIITEHAATPGEYELDPVNFHMPGLWQVLMSSGTPVNEQNTATFAFCIPG